MSTRVVNNRSGGQPETLDQARAELRRQRPERSAPAERWRAFHRCEAQMYTTVADSDPDHHYEALALAALAQQDAEPPDGGQLAAELATPDADTERRVDELDRTVVGSRGNDLPGGCARR